MENPLPAPGATCIPNREEALMTESPARARGYRFDGDDLYSVGGIPCPRPGLPYVIALRDPVM